VFVTIIMGVAMFGNLGLKGGMPFHFGSGERYRIMRVAEWQGCENECNYDGERGDGSQAPEQWRQQNG
jgi:hypothetical protein